jgi:hypothetical protein
MKCSALRAPDFVIKNATANTELSRVTGNSMTQNNFGVGQCKETLVTFNLTGLMVSVSGENFTLFL